MMARRKKLNFFVRIKIDPSHDGLNGLVVTSVPRMWYKKKNKNILLDEMCFSCHFTMKTLKEVGQSSFHPIHKKKERKKEKMFVRSMIGKGIIVHRSWALEII